MSQGSHENYWSGILKFLLLPLFAGAFLLSRRAGSSFNLLCGTHKVPGRWRVLNPGETVLHLKPFCRQGGRHGHSVGGEF